MDINEAFFESEIKSRVRFGKTIETVFDLSYLLIDFQDILWMSGFERSNNS